MDNLWRNPTSLPMWSAPHPTNINKSRQHATVVRLNGSEVAFRVARKPISKSMKLILIFADV